MSLTPKEWKSFQHYKERRPPWIKLHRPLLDNAEFQRLPVASRALAPMLWLLASEYDNGEITATPDDIAWRLRMPVAEFNEALKPLIEKKFFAYGDGASATLAPCEQETRPERETEVEAKREPDGVVVVTPTRGKSLISEEAFTVAGDLLEAMGLDREDPLSVGAPMTVQSWLNGGWPAEVIKVGVAKAMQNRKHDPPSTLKYFEKAIARTHAEMSRPLPIVEIQQAEKVKVTSYGTTAPQSGVVAAARRFAEQFEDQSGGCLEGNPDAVLRISQG